MRTWLVVVLILAASIAVLFGLEVKTITPTQSNAYTCLVVSFK